MELVMVMGNGYIDQYLKSEITLTNIKEI